MCILQMAKRITIKYYEKNGEIIEVNIPINRPLLEDTIELLRRETEPEIEDPVLKPDTPKISPELLQLKAFKDKMREYGNKYTAWIHIIKEVNNIINLEQKENKIVPTRLENKKEIEAIVKDIQDKVDLDFTKAAILHISSKLSSSQKDSIINQITSGLEPIEIIAFKTDKMANDTTMIEVLLFTNVVSFGSKK